MKHCVKHKDAEGGVLLVCSRISLRDNTRGSIEQQKQHELYPGFLKVDQDREWLAVARLESQGVWTPQGAMSVPSVEGPVENGRYRSALGPM